MAYLKWSDGEGNPREIEYKWIDEVWIETINVQRRPQRMEKKRSACEVCRGEEEVEWRRRGHEGRMMREEKDIEEAVLDLRGTRVWK